MKNEKRLNEKGLKARLARILTHEKWSGITVPIFCIILMLIVSSVLLLLLGKNPLTAFYSFLAGNGFAAKASYGAGSGMMSDFFQFLNVMAPMLLAALAFIFAYRCGLFNIGIAGQMLLSGFMATITVGYMQNLPGALARPLVILIGIVVGGLLGAAVGYLKYRFNIHEVVSTIMINYIISYTTGFFINAKFIDPVSRASRVISSQSRLTLTKVNVGGYLCNLPMGIIIAVVMAFLVYFIFEKTVFGFELKAVGSNRNAARYSGINVGRQLVQPRHQRFLSCKEAAAARALPQHDLRDPADPRVLRDRGRRIVSVKGGDQRAVPLRQRQVLMDRFFLRVVLRLGILHIQRDQLRVYRPGKPDGTEDHIGTGR